MSVIKIERHEFKTVEELINYAEELSDKMFVDGDTARFIERLRVFNTMVHEKFFVCKSCSIDYPNKENVSPADWMVELCMKLPNEPKILYKFVFEMESAWLEKTFEFDSVKDLIDYLRGCEDEYAQNKADFLEGIYTMQGLIGQEIIATTKVTLYENATDRSVDIVFQLKNGESKQLLVDHDNDYTLEKVSMY